MFHKILVALDESDSRYQVLKAAIALAKSTNAQLRLLHVLTSNERDFPTYPLTQINVGFVVDEMIYDEVLHRYAQERQAFEERHRDLLREAAQTALAEGVPTDELLAYGNPGRQICQIAADWKADTIVVGRRGNLGLKELWLGSVSNYVLHHAPCSVLVIQEAKSTQENRALLADLTSVNF